MHTVLSAFLITGRIKLATLSMSPQSNIIKHHVFIIVTIMQYFIAAINKRKALFKLLEIYGSFYILVIIADIIIKSQS